jgi:sRNA-binding regulator protein Hfq
MAEAKTASESKPRGPLDARLLCDKEVTITFLDGKILKGKVVQVDTYNLLTEYMGQKLLVPKHSVKYVLL